MIVLMRLNWIRLQPAFYTDHWK